MFAANKTNYIKLNILTLNTKNPSPTLYHIRFSKCDTDKTETTLNPQHPWF